MVITVSVKNISFYKSLGPAIQLQRLLSTPRFDVLQANTPKGLPIRRGVLCSQTPPKGLLFCSQTLVAIRARQTRLVAVAIELARRPQILVPPRANRPHRTGSRNESGRTASPGKRLRENGARRISEARATMGDCVSEGATSHDSFSRRRDLRRFCYDPLHYKHPLVLSSVNIIAYYSIVYCSIV